MHLVGLFVRLYGDARSIEHKIVCVCRGNCVEHRNMLSVVRSCLMLQQAVGLLTDTRCAIQVSEEEAIGFWNYAISHLIGIEFGVLP